MNNAATELERALGVMVKAMGTPVFSLPDRHGDLTSDRNQVVHFEPKLATHYWEQPNYAGGAYTQTTSIPGWDEDGALVVLNLCFDSGVNSIEVVSWPDADPALNAAAALLVRAYADDLF